MAREATGAPLNDRQLRALAIIVRAGPITPGALARELGVAAFAATRVIGRLDADGLIVRRHEGSGDLRNVQLHPTSAGRAHAERVLAALAGPSRRRGEAVPTA